MTVLGMLTEAMVEVLQVGGSRKLPASASSARRVFTSCLSSGHRCMRGRGMPSLGRREVRARRRTIALPTLADLP